MPALFLFLFLLLVPALTTAQPLITAGSGTEMISIGGTVEILEDPSGNITLEEARRSGSFKSSGQDVPNMQVSRSAFWVRFALRNDGPYDALFIHVPQPDIGHLTTHVVRANSASVEVYHSGQNIPLTRWQNKDLDSWTRIQVRNEDEVQVYIRVTSSKLLRLPITVGNSTALAKVRSYRDGFGGAYVGVIVVMLLYNLFIFLSTRDRNYLWYVVYITLVGITQADFLGITKHYLWPEHMWLGHNAAFLLTIATATSANLFMHRFLQTDVYAPRTIRWSWLFYGLFAVGLTMKALHIDVASYHLLQTTTGGMALYQLTVGFIALRSGSRGARFFLLAWTIFLMGVMFYVLKDLDILPYTAITKHTMVVGSAIEVVLLSFGLADKINILRRDKERSQAEALAAAKENERIIREQNSLLEHKVQERTQALQESNEHLKQTQVQLVNAEKMASLGQLTAGIAHEINNPINFITSNIQPLRRNLKDILEVMKAYQELKPEDAAQKLKELKALEERIDLAASVEEMDDIIASIAEGSSRTSEIVRGLRNFSRLDEDDLKDADLNEGLRSTLTVLGPQYRDRVNFSLELGDIPKVECFPGKVNQVFMNILTNGVQATLERPDQSERKVRVRTSTDGDHVHIQIADNGVGMSDAVKARIFEPFFTTKSVGEGTGLGMAIVYGIINDHHGSIAIDSMPGAGTEFTITLPLRQDKGLRKRA